MRYELHRVWVVERYFREAMLPRIAPVCHN
jgi:hypothetical protein